MRALRDGTRAAVVAAALTGTIAGCGPDGGGAAFEWTGFASVRADLLEPGRLVQVALLEGPPGPLLELESGALPSGLRLGEDGVLRGTPLESAEVARFCVGARTPERAWLGRRCYALGTGVFRTNLVTPSPPPSAGAVLDIDYAVGRELESAFVFDPALRLFWPLGAGTAARGSVLGSPGGVLELVARTDGAEGRFALAAPTLDARVGAVAQLTWVGDGALELHLLPEPDLAAPPVDPATPLLEHDGLWRAAHVVASTAGAQAVLLTADAPPGRYALVAVRRGGTAVELALRLSARRPDGATLAEERIDAFLSDVATGSVADELAAGRQSCKPLGLLEIRRGELHFLRAARSGGPFDVEAGD